jgi:uncharacterized membrane protein YbhN (UPF0104 family)
VITLAAALAAAGVALVWSGLANRGFDWALFARTFTRLNYGWVAASAVLALATYVGRALRWAVLIAPVKPRPNLRNLLSATMIGFTAITLLGRPGELVRPYLIATRERVPLSSQLAALMLERIYDLLAALLVFGFALSRVEASEVHAGPALGWVLRTGGTVAAAVALTCSLILVLIRQYSEKMRGRMLDGLKVLPERIYPKAERLVNAFVQGVESTRSWRALAALAGYTALEWALITGTMLCLVRAFPALEFGMVDVLIFMGFVSFGAIVQLPGIGGGFQVVAVLVLTELFAIRLEVAASVAMMLWAVTFLIVVPPGLLLALREGLNWMKLKELGREVAP